MGYRFRRAAAADLPMLRRWMEEPEVRAWWGDPGFETRLIADDLDNPGIAMWIVEHEGRPFAYIQDYELAQYWPHAFGQPP